MNKSIISQGIISKYNIRFSFVDSTKLMNQVILQKNADPLLSNFILDACQSALCLIPTLGDKESLLIRWEYQGLLSSSVLEINSHYEFRCYFSSQSLMDKTKEVSKVLVDTGKILVARYKNKKKVSEGITEAPLLNHAKDLAYFFSTSEQQETEIHTQYLIQNIPNKPILLARAIMVQAMPNCDYKKLEKIINMFKKEEIRQIVQNTNLDLHGISQAIEKIWQSQLDILEEKTLKLFCTCNKEKLQSIVKKMSLEEKQEIIAQEGAIKITCDFCNTLYKIL